MPNTDRTSMATCMPFEFAELRHNHRLVTLMIDENIPTGSCHVKFTGRLKSLRMSGGNTIDKQKAPVLDIPERVIDFPPTGREA